MIDTDSLESATLFESEEESSCDCAWAPDGRQVIFVRRRDDDLQELYKLNTDNNELINLSVKGIYRYYRPQWSPDGEHIVFVSDDGIYTLRSNGTELRKVHEYFATSPYWSPDGRFIAFGAIEDGEYVINVVRDDGSDLRRITQRRRNSLYLDWSPNGTQIAFEAIFDNRNFAIALANTDGSGEVQLTNNSGEDKHPSWSPDGKQIVFESNFDGGPEIYKIDVGNGEQTRLTHNSVFDTHPEWSPSGESIAFLSGDLLNTDELGIYIMNTDGSEQRPLIHTSWSICCIEWQP